MERPPIGDVEDLASLAKLDEAILLDEIKERYRRDQIYTYVGDILIAVNPFKDLGIYGREYSERYHNAKQSANPPHIFAVADAAYQALMGHGGKPPGNQCILISGESGAGKTESTKLIIKQLVELCKGNTQLEQQILQVNPLLEAFGNAQTNLNDNSSRFGKYIQLKFSSGHLVGAKISEYLLEKSRVVRQNAGEENFHIFYYLFASSANGNYGLDHPGAYRYVTNGADDFSYRLSTLNTRYEELVNAMDLVGFTDEEQADMFAVIASVLHLGNISFDINDADDSVTVVDSDGQVKTAAKLLGIDASEVEACLTCMVTVTKGEYVKRNYNIDQAEEARDAMAKTVYGRLFGWIVNKINCLLVPEDHESTNLSEIGILDIFGFEDFIEDGGKNSFEQACINLANEQLQFFFNQHIFKMEQEEYRREGIDWTEIRFVDNKPLLDMFLAKPIGILSLLDEETLFPKGTDLSYVEKLSKAMSDNAYFKKSQQTNQAVFSVNHYAGKVTYTADGWLEKNRDTLPPGITELLQSSSNTLIKTIFRGQITRTGSLALQGRKSASRKKGIQKTPSVTRNDAATRKLTVGGQFKNSLNILMERMMSSTPSFVRCLKPNHIKAPGDLDSRYVLAQLLYTGMLETIEIRRKGFAVRPTFAHFVEKYKVLVDLKLHGTAQSCATILRAAKIQGWCLGKTKVFLKYAHIEQLTDLLDIMSKSVVQLQKVVRGFLGRKEFCIRKEHARREKEAMEEMLRQAMQLSNDTSQLQNSLIALDKSKPKVVQQGQLPSLPDYPPDAISIASSGNYLEPTIQMVSTSTQMEEANSSDSEVLEDDFQPVRSNSGKFGQEGTKQAAVTWFKETQTYNVMDQNQNKFADWFHGIISRKEAEVLLRSKIVGCFLIRVSESRFGYTLSFNSEKRCRHYMIDQLKNGKFIIIGEPKVHRSLHNLVQFHKKVQISNWDGLLTVPCGQADGECDYHELVSQNAPFPNKQTPPQLPPRPVSSDRSSASHPRFSAELVKGRPLPKLPEESYAKLLTDQGIEESKYKSLDLNNSKQKQKNRVGASRKKF